MTTGVAGAATLVIGLLTAALTIAAEPSHQSFSSKAWRDAVDKGKADWSREDMIREFVTIVPESKLIGKTREQIIALFGEPGFSTVSYYPGGSPPNRVDIYRLSAKNGSSLRFDYRPENTVLSVSLESSPCACIDCNSDAAATREALIRKVLRSAPSPDGATPTLAQLETLLAGPGKSSVLTIQAGGQMWNNYLELWRIKGEPHRYFMASGHVPTRDWISIGAASAREFAVTTIWPDCLPP